MPKFKFVLFDLDGTLTDPKIGITTCMKYSLEKVGIPVGSPEFLTRFIGAPLTDLYIKHYGLSEEKSREAIEYYRERYSTVGIFQNEVTPGITALLSSLTSSGVKLGVATSKPGVFAERILDRYGLGGYIDAMAGSELDGRRTAKSEVITEVMRLLKAEDKSQIIMIGDRVHDIRGAREVGITCCAVRWGYSQKGELDAATPDYIADSVDDLRKLLLN